MIKKIIEYQCGICNKGYNKESEAKECEAQGVPKLIPIGTVFSMFDDNKEMVFAIIKQFPNNYGHHHSYSTWACRDTQAGDNASGDRFCGLASWDKIYLPNNKIPAYTRMIKALKKSNIKPIDYQG